MGPAIALASSLRCDWLITYDVRLITLEVIVLRHQSHCRSLRSLCRITLKPYLNPLIDVVLTNWVVRAAVTITSANALPKLTGMKDYDAWVCKMKNNLIMCSVDGSTTTAWTMSGGTAPAPVAYPHGNRPGNIGSQCS
jgi:hypothetical protein